MSAPPPPLKPIEPKSPRWQPTPDANDIVIPGLDTSAPPGEQIEQLEQLITIKLQNIDANFSKIQQIMSGRILPAVKRYAVSTEPVREAAKFWTTFFEQAAQIRVPTYDDYAPPSDTDPSLVADSDAPGDQSESQTSPTDVFDATPSRSHIFNPDSTSSEVSFAPNAAISSTPATVSRQRADGYGDDPTPSWSASLESPLIRLDREIQSLTRDDEISAASSSMANLSLNLDDSSADITQRAPPSSSILQFSAAKDKGKGREEKRTLSFSDACALAVGLYQPQQTKGSGSTTPKRNADEDDSFDFGMSPPITTDFARLPTLGKTPKKEAAERIMKSLLDVEKRFGGGTGSGGTSAAADGRNGGGAHFGASKESSMTSVPTPPSLSRYIHPAAEASSSSVADASLESLMRRVGDGFSGHYNGGATAQNVSSRTSIASESAGAVPSSSSSTASSSLQPHRLQQQPPPARPQVAPFLPVPEQTPDQPVFSVFRPQDPGLLVHRASATHQEDEEFEHEHEHDVSLSSDSSFGEDEMNNTANPSAAFLIAAQRASYDDDDDSFDSSNQSMDSMDGEPQLGQDGAPVHPLAHVLGGGEMGEEDGFDDDSFDDPAYQQEGTEEETLFGVPPAQRLQQQQLQQGHLRMLGEELLEDTMGIGAQMARAGRVEESPTPWGGQRE
ncbi:DASH complex subunit ask1 [Steccherinum ochraceum]|uniref:DASH complex subunit ASK1 n=1 Tax=Steccherinum ochraceum TaxID=92696 RepID=A0A4R0RHR3_9APHY|nr:DASH complex subunit ask1 [Steccherinum ochraceum]